MSAAERIAAGARPTAQDAPAGAGAPDAERAACGRAAAGEPGVQQRAGAAAAASEAAPAALCDLHVHLGFAANAARLARDLAASGTGALCATVEPDEFLRLQRILPDLEEVRLGVGLHPWWIADGRCGEADVAACERLAAQARFIAEVGLDFGRRHGTARDAQLDAFGRICAVAGRAGGKVLSIHAVNAAAEALDVLERAGCVGAASGDGRGAVAPAPCACILHWYSGPSDQLQRAIARGCFFSVGERMLATRRGRAYARAIPANRLVLETDLPEAPCNAYDAALIRASLARALAALEEVRDESMGAAVIRNSRMLLAWGEADGGR
ncbi:MAG TPA: TatD family hydrolase [Candidatus Aphodovivens avistercoris]|nr:TatD family hydrolase [Candidatus Aphodovivens avistercoris]